MKSWLYLSLLFLSSCSTVALSQAEYTSFMSLADEVQKLEDQNHQLVRQMIDMQRRNQEDQENLFGHHQG